MKTRLVVVTLGLAALWLVGVSPLQAQVRVGFGLHIVVPAEPVESNIVVAAPFPGGVWVRAHWAWDEYTGRNVWIRGHWIVRRPPPVVRKQEWQHVPHGVAKGWWKKHGGQGNERYYRDEDRYEDRDRN